jgi:basic membrane protein A and related proteins
MPKWLRSLLVPLAVLALVAAACGDSGGPGGDGSAAPECASDLKVGVSLDVGGLGDKSFNDAAKAGLDKAIADGLVCEENTKFLESNAEGSNRDENTINLADAGYNLVWANGFAFSEDIKKISPEYPDVDFAVQDGFAHFLFGNEPNPNVLDVTFEENTGSYLVGIAAAMTTKTGTVGFLGGQEGTGLIEKFQAGYEAGVKSVDSSIEVLVEYIGDSTAAFVDQTKGEALSAGMYDKGADVIYHAAGQSGLGLFKAAVEHDGIAIGVDSDQYLTASPEEQPHILTSMLKRVDVAIYNVIKSAGEGTFEPGGMVLTMADDGVAYGSGAPHLLTDEIKAAMDTARERIIGGQVKVPTEP